MSSFFEPAPGLIRAHHNDGTHEYFGCANKGSKTTEAKWSIMKMEYDVSYLTAGDNWITKHPYPAGGVATDEPKFKWSEVASLNYNLLGLGA